MWRRAVGPWSAPCRRSGARGRRGRGRLKKVAAEPLHRPGRLKELLQGLAHPPRPARVTILPYAGDVYRHRLVREIIQRQANEHGWRPPDERMDRGNQGVRREM